MNGTNIFNGMFGKIEAGLVRLDVHGNVAVKTTNGYKSYSTKSKRLINCDSFVFDIGEEFFWHSHYCSVLVSRFVKTI